MVHKRKGEQLREQIVAAANQLFYERGFNQTSFSDIAEAAGVARGNFYYYFKTKDEILEAVIASRLQDVKDMLVDWEASLPDPCDRLHRYVQILLNEQQAVTRYGCPMGSLSAELGKTQQPQQGMVAEMMTTFRDWLHAQFRALGCGRASRDHALHLLAASQGVAMVAHTYADAAFVRREARKLNEWIDSICEEQA